MYQSTANQERNQQPCKMMFILPLPASRHDKHDTHKHDKHTTHAAPGDMSTTTHHSSRSTAAPMSSLPLPPHFCSAMIVVAPLLRCAIQSAAAALGLAALSSQPSSFTFQPVFHPPPAHQHHYSWLDCFMLLVVVFLPRVIRHHSPHMQKKKKNSMPPLSTT